MPIRLLEMTKSPLVHIGLAIPIVYFIASFFLPSWALIESGDSFVVPMAFAASSVYARDLFEDTKGRPFDYIDLVMLGISGGWLTNAADRGYRLYSRLFEDSLSPDSHWIGFCLFMLTYFAALHVYAKGWK